MTFYLNKALRNLLLLLLSLYFAQGTFYSTGSIIAKFFLLLILLISSFYFIKSLLEKRIQKDFFYYAWGALLLVNTFGFFLEGNFGGIHLAQYRNILTALLPFFPFYYFASRGTLTSKHLRYFSLILLPIFIASFFSSRHDLMSQSLNNTENVVTNTAYLFVALIPYIFLWGKQKLIAAAGMVLLLFFIIQGAKRGALIVALMGCSIFIYYLLSSVEPKKRVRSFLVALVGIGLLAMYVYDFYISNEFLINRMQKISDGGSGRDFIYLNLLTNWYESNSVINYLFGFGFVSTIKYSGSGHLAHNDWLELLTNFGLVGISIYLLVFYAATRFIFDSSVQKEHKLIMLTIVLMWFLQTLFSMYYTTSSTAFTSILLGYLFGSHQYNKKKYIRKQITKGSGNENTLRNR